MLSLFWVNQALSGESKTDAPVFQPLPAGVFELGGSHYELQSANHPWSAQRAINRPSLLRFELREGDKWPAEPGRPVNRAEIFALDDRLYKNGDVFNVTGRFRFIQGDLSNSQNFFSIFQVKSVHLNRPGYRDPGTNPALVLVIKDNHQLSLESRTLPLSPPDNRYAVGIIPPTVVYKSGMRKPGEWNSLYLRVKLGVSNDAELEFWLNGTKRLSLKGVNIGISNRDHYVKFGIYRSEIAPGEIASVVEWADIEHGLENQRDLSSRRTAH